MNAAGRTICHVHPDDGERTRLRVNVDGGRSDADIAGVLDVGTATVERGCAGSACSMVRRRRSGARPRRTAVRLLDGEGEAKLRRPDLGIAI